jgi:hypothetical protein
MSAFISSLQVNSQLLVDVRTQPKIIALPFVRTIPFELFYVKDAYGNSANSTISLVPSGSDTIDWQGTTASNSTFALPLSTPFTSVLLTNDGISNWSILQHKVFNSIPLFLVRTFAYTGVDQTLTIPPSVNAMYVFMWGAGGGGSTGGAGAMIQGIFPVIPGETLTVVVGGAGPFQATAYGQLFGNAYNTPGWGGGGVAGIKRAGAYVVGAGGGGGSPNNQIGIAGNASFNSTVPVGGAGSSGNFNGIPGSFYNGGGGGGGGGGTSGVNSTAGGGGISLITNFIGLIPGQSVYGFSAPSQGVAPNQTSVYYPGSVGGQSQNGYIYLILVQK